MTFASLILALISLLSPNLAAPQVLFTSTGSTGISPLHTYGSETGSPSSCNSGADFCISQTITSSVGGAANPIGVAACSRNFSTPPNFISASGVSWTHDANYGNYCSAWYVNSPPAAVTSISVGSTANNDVSIFVVEYQNAVSGFDLSDYTNTGSGSAPSFGPITPGGSDSCYGASWNHDTGTMTPSLAGWATASPPGDYNAGNISMAYQTASKSSAFTYNPTLANGEATGGVACFK